MEGPRYIDPGTGGMIVSSLWAVISGFLAMIATFLLAYFVRPLKKILSKIWKFIRGVRTRYVSFILLLIIITIACYVFSPGLVGMKNTEKKVILIGIDALDPRIMEKLMGEGKLPNFKRLAEMGSYSRLETTIPPETPVAWSAAATGSNPGKYGIFDFIRRDPTTYFLHLSLTNERKTPFGTKYESAMKGLPFWRITSEHGIGTVVIRWPVTFPPEKIKGRMLSGLGVVDIRGFLNSYSFYTTKDIEGGEVGRVVKVKEENGTIKTNLFGPMVRKGGEVVDSTSPMKIRLYEDHVLIEVSGSEYEVKVNEWSDWIRVKFRVDFLTEVYGIFKVYLLSLSPFEMYVTSIQIDPENPIVDITYPREYGKELVKEIGLFYTLGMPEDTKAVTEERLGRSTFFQQVKEIERERERMFWHEFERFKDGVFAFAFDSNDRLQHIFWEEGEIPEEVEWYYRGKDALLGKVLDRIGNDTYLMIFSDHGFTSFERAVNINTWLVKNGYMSLTKNLSEITEDDPGSLFKYVDWERTKAYSLGFTSIYLNLKGREGKGIVEEKERLVEEIMEKLKRLTDPKTGRRVIGNLYKGGEVYEGEYAKEAPDIIIGFNPGYRMSWQSAMGGVTPWIIKDNEEEWKGDHLIDRNHVPGVLFTNFKIRKQNPSIMDIAPTVLSLLGLEIPKSMDGESLVGE